MAARTRGARGPSGALEKDLTLQIARRLKAAIESRGLRVLLTREGDEDVPIDRRTSLANNNKADISSACMPTDRRSRTCMGHRCCRSSWTITKRRPRLLPPIPGRACLLWATACAQSTRCPGTSRKSRSRQSPPRFAGVLVRQLTGRAVPLYTRAQDVAPLAILVGANMPAVLIEMGVPVQRRR